MTAVYVPVAGGDVRIGLRPGSVRGVALGVRSLDGLEGLTLTATAAQARQIARALLAEADALDAAALPVVAPEPPAAA